MRICVVAYKFGTEDEMGRHLGTYHYFIEKMRTLSKRGASIYVVCPWLSMTQKGSAMVDGVRVIRYWPPLPRIAWFIPLYRLLRLLYIRQTQQYALKVVKQYGCDRIYIWQAREAGYAIAQIKNRLGIPFYFRQITAWKWHFERSIQDVFSHRPWYVRAQRMHLVWLFKPYLAAMLDVKTQRRYAAEIYKEADKVVFLSKAAAQEGYQLGLTPSKAAVLGIALEDDLFKPLENKSALRTELAIRGEKAIIFIGRINFAEKGVGYLLEAMPRITQEFPGAILIIIGGGGESDRMRQMIRTLRIEPNVLLVGKKPYEELARYINAADVMVVPSIWMEAFGHVTIQGMACAVPVVTSDAGASPEINIHGKTGLVVPAKDSSALADGLLTLLRDKELRERMGKAARQRFLDQYTYRAITDRFLSILYP